MSDPILPLGKHVARDPATGDYAAYYDRELLGYRRTHDEAQSLADQHARDLARRAQPCVQTRCFASPVNQIASSSAGAE